MPHVVLVGDALLDNTAYAGGAPSIPTLLGDLLGPSWTVTSLAADGATMGDVSQQLRSLPGEAGFLVMSAGGQDALAESDLLFRSISSVGEALDRVTEMLDRFAVTYQALVDKARLRVPRVALCTIYEPPFRDPEVRRRAATALVLFNDIVLRTASATGLPIADLRAACTEPDDFAAEIKPSARGGRKIARAIATLLLRHDFDSRVAALYVG